MTAGCEVISLNASRIRALATSLSLLNCLDESVIAVDPDCIIGFVNESTCELFGYREEELVGQHLDVLLPLRSHAVHRGEVEKFKDAPDVHRKMQDRGGVSGLRKDGKEFDAEVSISKTWMQGELFMLAVVRDVSERRRSEARLRASEARQRAVLEACSDAVLLVDTGTGAVIEANARAELLFGSPADQIAGMPLADLLPGLAARQPMPAGALNPGGPAIETIAARKDGRIVPVEVSMTAADLGREPMIVAFVRDISRQKHKEAELTRAKEIAHSANESKTRFLASLSHELRTPLNAIIGMSELLQSGIIGHLSNPKHREYVTDIHDSGQHLLEVINDILDFSRLEIGKVVINDDELNLADVVGYCLRTVRQLLEDASLRWSNEVGEEFRLCGDRRAVRQMLINLLSNSLKHTNPGGTVRVRGIRRADGGVTLEVADTGVGIPADRLDRVTEPFNLDQDIQVNSQRGTGLGLSITKRLLEMHGGWIEIESVEGKGTSVCLNFPPARSLPAGAT